VSGAESLPGPDRAVLEELANRGDVGSIPREVRIWIYGSKPDLDLVAERLASTWSDVLPAECEGRWSILAHRMQEATEDAILAMSSEIDAALAGTAADYDGWETSVEQSN
jgi:hypothetical protein